MNQNPKRIVIIEGDAFDADAIVAIIKFRASNKFGVVARFQDGIHAFDFLDAPTRDAAIELAIFNWRQAVGDGATLPPTPAESLPDQPGPAEPSLLSYWSDEKGRYYETYGDTVIYYDPTLGNFIWNEGPPRRKNPLGEGASPINRVYVDEVGKPLDQQPS